MALFGGRQWGVWLVQRMVYALSRVHNWCIAFACVLFSLFALSPLSAHAAAHPDSESEKTSHFIQLCTTAGPEEVQAALKQGADPNAMWVNNSQISKTKPHIIKGDTALIAAVRNNTHIASIRVLLETGADPNPKNDTEDFPLVIAIRRNMPDLVSLLLEYGARVSGPSGYGGFLLQYAVEKNPDILAHLLKAGVNSREAGPGGVIALHSAAQRSAVNFSQLVEAGADARAVTDEGKTVLHYAVMNVSPDPVVWLLAAGLDPNAVDETGNTPLHERVGSAQIVEYMIKAGANVNLDNKKYLAPFETNSDESVVDALLAAGAEMIVGDANGRRKVRGFAEGSSGYSHTRFFAASDAQYVFQSQKATPTTLQKAALPLVPLEQGEQADPAYQSPKYDEQVLWTAEGGKNPIPSLLYYIESAEGALVYGRTDHSGGTARVYTPGPEPLAWRGGAEGAAALEAIFSSDRAPYLFDGKLEDQSPVSRTGTGSVRYGEKICFVHPVERHLVVGYPYFVLSDAGYGIGGTTGENGCTAELFVPSSGTFSVYGGSDGVRMNVNGHPD